LGPGPPDITIFKKANPTNSAGSTEAIITFVGDHGGSCSCNILEIFDLDYSKYALLRKIDGDEWGAHVLIRVVPSNGRARFECIEDETEFDLVVSEIETRSDFFVQGNTLGRHIF
jgi:Protein of unknown function (DUF1292)